MEWCARGAGADATALSVVDVSDSVRASTAQVSGLCARRAGPLHVPAWSALSAADDGSRVASTIMVGASVDGVPIYADLLLLAPLAGRSGVRTRVPSAGASVRRAHRNDERRSAAADVVVTDKWFRAARMARRGASAVGQPRTARRARSVAMRGESLAATHSRGHCAAPARQ